MYPRVELSLVALALVWLGFSGQLSILATGKHRSRSLTWSGDFEQLVDPMHKFAASLMRAAGKGKENLIFSPISIHSALSLVLLGARTKSETQKALLKVLGHHEGSRMHELYAKLLTRFRETTRNLKSEPAKTDEDMDPVIDMWTAGFANKSLPMLPEYLQEVNKYYYTTVESINIENEQETKSVLDKVNQWGRKVGFGGDLVNAGLFGGNFALALMSAIQMRAFWFDQFKEYKAKEVFYNLGLKSGLVKDGRGLKIDDVLGRYVVFSRKSSSALPGEAFKQLSLLDFRAIQVPLRGHLSYTIFEPLKHESGHELDELIESLTTVESSGKTKLAKAFRVLDTKEGLNRFGLQMPAFKFESDINLGPVLKSETFGLEMIFDKNRADLSKMRPDRPLYVSGATHKAMIEVTKVGIKAAALTVVKIVIKSAPPQELEVKYPFLFVIRYGHLPLFMGTLVSLEGQDLQVRPSRENKESRTP